ncbi:hypothetical protein [Plantactinospora sp. DSM 117369]
MRTWRPAALALGGNRGLVSHSAMPHSAAVTGAGVLARGPVQQLPAV